MLIVPAPAMTAGIVKTPVPTMLPTTSAVADVRPNECALYESLDDGSVDIGAWSGSKGTTGLMVTSSPWSEGPTE
jgi:hypothetical protein